MKPENTSILTISSAQNSPILSKTNYVTVALLRENLENLIQREIELRTDALDRVELVFQNNVRIGWVLLDIKEILRGEFTLYAENNLPFSGRTANRLMLGAKLFKRDKENLDLIVSIQNPQLEYSYTEKPLVEQIRELRAKPNGPRYFNDLLVTSGLAPSRQTKNAQDGRIGDISGFFKLVRSIDNASARLIRFQREFPVEQWSEDDCEIVKRKLQPLKEFYERNF